MSIVITAVYILRSLATVFHGPVTNPAFEKLGDATLSEKVATGVLVATLIVVGSLPWYLLNLLEGSLMPFINRLHL